MVNVMLFTCHVIHFTVKYDKYVSSTNYYTFYVLQLTPDQQLHRQENLQLIF